jgi:hypothetical protein
MGTATALFVLDHLRARREASRVLGSRRIRIAPSIGRGMAGIDAGWEF